MYESPIELIQKQMQLDLESKIMSAVQEVGISVDKDELVRALKYDRDQYEKGYADAKAEQGDMIPVEWIELHISALEFIGKKESVRRAEAIRNMLGIWRYEQKGN